MFDAGERQPSIVSGIVTHRRPVYFVMVDCAVIGYVLVLGLRRHRCEAQESRQGREGGHVRNVLRSVFIFMDFSGIEAVA